jgi:hypothetical protein
VFCRRTEILHPSIYHREEYPCRDDKPAFEFPDAQFGAYGPANDEDHGAHNILCAAFDLRSGRHLELIDLSRKSGKGNDMDIVSALIKVVPLLKLPLASLFNLESSCTPQSSRLG